MLRTVGQAEFDVVHADYDGWDDYVRQHPRGTIFHTSAMIRTFAATQNLEPHALAAVDRSGKIIAMLAGCHVRTHKGLPACLSSRAIQYAEPLCNVDPAGVEALRTLIGRHDRYMRQRALFCEVRVHNDPQSWDHGTLVESGYGLHDYINYIVELDSDIDVLWQNLHKRLRQKIRSTFRKQIEIRDDQSPEGIERLYRLLQTSFARAKVPLLGREMFETALTQLPGECVRLRTAFFEDRPVASVLSLLFKHRIYSWYGGTQRLPGISPFACIVWDDICWAKSRGYSEYDFGGAGWPHEDYGPRRFKAQFGGRAVRYGRYLHTYSHLRLTMAKLVYAASRRCGAWS